MEVEISTKRWYVSTLLYDLASQKTVIYNPEKIDNMYKYSVRIIQFAFWANNMEASVCRDTCLK
jgi:hypothetical protein